MLGEINYFIIECLKGNISSSVNNSGSVSDSNSSLKWLELDYVNCVRYCIIW